MLNLSLLKGMNQLIRFLSHLFELLPIDYFKVIIFINWHMASPNYHSFWSNSSLWLHKYSIADEKVYLQRWMLNHSTIKSITILSPFTVDKIVQKKLQIRDCRDGDNTKMGEFGYFYQSKHWWCSAGTHLFCYNVKLKVAENLSSMRL